MKSVIFDINGTMFIDTEYHKLAWEECLVGEFERTITDEEFAAHMFGPTNANIIKYLFDGRLTKEQTDRLAFEKEAAYRRICQSQPGVALTKGLPEALDALKAAGVPITIATGAPMENLKFYWELFGMGKWFDLSKVVYDDGILPGKPDPAIYREAAKKLGQDPADCVVVEDAIFGHTAAMGAGIGEVVMIDSSVAREQLEQLPGVKHIIRDFTDFDRYILS